MTHLFVPTNFKEMDEFFLSSKMTHGQLPIMRFFLKDQIYYYYEVLLIRSPSIDNFQFPEVYRTC